MLEMSEHTKNMYNPAYEKGFIFGKQWWSNYERKRIIKLLEERYEGDEFVAEQIELIKGETNE